jgi:hypothetical protein
MTTNIHTIPIPRGWSVEQAWEHIDRNDGIVIDGSYWWANILVVDGRYRGTVDEPDDTVLPSEP